MRDGDERGSIVGKLGNERACVVWIDPHEHLDVCECGSGSQL
ncbi:hypothetical protein CPTB_00519 [Corynebacterium pseudotuberculosis]|nr:Hypothetical protein Cp3995_0475 [Corynebacterium pseudotuberculosis 3/99-5]AIG06843.1 hypothetical protein CPTA_01014 [Corynebacterium pseudotuberculosis]AIG08575.1 hypothetical protein CPTB_00519 [Corynebacterium pseudotuberculosis]